MKAPRVQKSKLLLCEGKDEGGFFTALSAHLGRTDVQILEVGGKTLFAPNLAALVRDPLFPTVTDILVVRDADFLVDQAGLARTWQSVTDTLRANGLPVPVGPGQFAAGPPRVAAFVMPDCQTDGMLETLCAAAVQADPAAPCVAAYFACLQNQAGITHVPRNRDKAFVRAFLASRPEPDKRLGEAALAGYWPWTDPAFAPLVGLLNQL